MAERFGAVYRIVSYRIAIFCAVSYRIHRFPPRPYHAITISLYGVQCMLTLSMQLSMLLGIFH